MAGLDGGTSAQVGSGDPDDDRAAGGGDGPGPAPGAPALPWGTQWVLVSAADASVDWTAFHVTLGLQDGRAGGRAPVNRYFGMCADLGGGGVELGPFGMTMMAGPPAAMAAETAFVRMLDAVRGYRVGAGSLVLVDGQGDPVLEFVPEPDPT